MKVQKAINDLKVGELEQTAAKDDQAAILSYINQGVLELHKRFDLWKESFTITLVTDLLDYKLDGTDANVLIDLTDHQLLIVTELYNSDMDEIHPSYLTGPRWVKNDHLQFLTIADDEFFEGADVLTGHYRAAPVDLKDEKETISLPPQFQEALYHYVGYRAHTAMVSEIQAEHTTHYDRFDKSCGRVIFQGLDKEPDLFSNKFADRGFV